jgi:hypothetical protein
MTTSSGLWCHHKCDKVDFGDQTQDNSAAGSLEVQEKINAEIIRKIDFHNSIKLSLETWKKL